MTLWLAWTVATSALVGIATAAVEQIAALLRAPRRFVWMGALLACTMGPTVLALRSTPAAPLPGVTVARGLEVATATLRGNRVPTEAGAIDATVGDIVPSRTENALDIPGLVRRADW
ncbi:MAG: hypothetical protein ACREBE_24620 [bacterium]